MKKFSSIFRYISEYTGKLLVYVVTTILSNSFFHWYLSACWHLSCNWFFQPVSENCNCAQQVGLNSHAVGGLLNETIIHFITVHGKLSAVALICAFIIAATIFKNLFLYISYLISAPVRSSIVTRLRADLYDKILTLPVGYFTEQRKGDVISRMTNDVSEIESSIISTLEGLVKDPLTVLFYLAYLVYLSPGLSLFLLILLPATAFLVGRISRTLKKQSQAAAVKLGEALSILDETLTGIRVIKAFIAEKLMLGRFHEVNDKLFHIRNKMNARRDLASPLTEVLGVSILCAILYFGARLALSGNTGSMDPSILLVYIATFALLINPAKNLSTSFFNVQRGAAAIDRVEELLADSAGSGSKRKRGR